MKLLSAKSENDWKLASEILLSVIQYLELNKKSLWKYKQADVDNLKSLYKLEELYFFGSEGDIYGMVFLQREDPLFWPEINSNESFFIHKLAVLPRYKGMGYGYKILDSVLKLARKKKIKYLRLDCDPRPGLTSYYESYGFSFVSNFMVGEFPVVKYELLAR